MLKVLQNYAVRVCESKLSQCERNSMLLLIRYVFDRIINYLLQCYLLQC